MNEPIGRSGSLMPARARMMASATRVTALILTDDSPMQDLVEAQELVAFAFLEAGDGDAGPAGDDRGDLVGGHDLAQQAPAALLGHQVFLLAQQPTLQLGEPAVAQVRRRG